VQGNAEDEDEVQEEVESVVSDDYEERAARRFLAQLDRDFLLAPGAQPIPGPLPTSNPEPPSPTTSNTTGTNNEDLHARFLRLRQLPTIFKPIPTSMIRPFAKACDRLAKAYLANPADATLLDILALPKVGLMPALATKSAPVAKAILESYPNVPWPAAPTLLRFASGQRTLKLIESGRLSSAARTLTGESKVADVTPEAIDSLKSKHPTGPTHPFPRQPGPMPCRSPDIDDLKNALKRFASDTAPGISGWTVPLLRQAINMPEFARFIVALTAAMNKGTAPGASMLCTSRLTPLLKPDGGIRPIAVGELFYRLATKTILKTAFKPDFLLPNQLGVGSKGGVEPIARAVERALAGNLPLRYSHLVSLDFTNAFNTANRLLIVSALKDHAPALYRLAKWAYNNASDLVIGDHILKSAQGVRQGDPLGPLFFSLSIRALLTKLIATLGEGRLVFAYLDDIYILSVDGDALKDVYDFFDREDTTLKLNRTKCAQVSLEQVRTDGFKMLGTCIGPATARRDFLQGKIDSVIGKLDELHHLPHQHALVLLRQCIQQDIRHLQRTLDTDNIQDVWTRLDDRLEKEIKRMTAGGDKDSPHGKVLANLPARLGGLGVLSHKDCAPLARQAAMAEADLTLDTILGPAQDRERREGTGAPVVKSQGERCKEMWEKQQEDLLEKMADRERKLLVESASAIGRKWLSIIPYRQQLRLSDYDIATGLAYRLQTPPASGHCMWCGDSAELGHDELCLNRTRGTIQRHNAIARAIAQQIASDRSTTVDLEPSTFEGARRNDIRWHGAPTHGRGTVDFDVKVYSVLSVHAHKTTTRRPADTSLVTHATNQCIKHLDSIGRKANADRPLAATSFKPLVFSTGGLMSKETATEVASWKAALGDTAFGRLGTFISLELVKARARTFGMLR
jgi:hypothetical protein